jgi:hypothetical protein
MAKLGVITMWVVGMYDTHGDGDWAVVRDLSSGIDLGFKSHFFSGRAERLERWCQFNGLGYLIREVPITLVPELP